jgi:cytoskeletal protein RodZ
MPAADRSQSSTKTPTKTVGKSEKAKPTSKVGIYQITTPAAAAAEQIAAELHLPAAALVDLAVREWTRSWIEGKQDP